MSLHDDERLVAAVAAALGETIALVRRRGFHIDSRVGSSEVPLASSRCRPATDDFGDHNRWRVDWGRCGSRARRRRFAVRTNENDKVE